MASGTYHCKDCCLYFDSSQSLDVHLQYHKENLMNMWMGGDEMKRESNPDGSSSELGPGAPDMNSMTSRSTNQMNTAAVSSANAIFIKEECKDPNEMEPQPTFIGPSPISPMEYIEPGISSPQGNLISQGPPSGSGIANFSQPSPGGYYQDFNQHHHLQQSQFNNFQPSYINGGYDDQFYNRGASNQPRFHPYGRSPVPTPSPGGSNPIDIKEERLTPNTPEILDLDSQKVLNSNGNQQTQMGSLPPMWRPHEQFPSPTSSSNICGSSPGMGPSPTGLRPTSAGIGPSPSGLGPSPSGLGPSPSGLGPSPSGLGPSPSGLGPSPSGLGPSPSGLGPSPSGLGAASSGLGPAPSGLGPSPALGPPVTGLGQSTPGLGPIPSGLGLTPSPSPMGVPSGLGASQMSMLPPMQQPSYGSQHSSLPPNHQIISVPNNSPGFQSNPMSSFYPQGLPASSGMTSNSSVQFSSTPTPSPSPRDAPPTEYPSNVKRAKSFKCEDCNKWFTSHGHLKRHYNTTLHKNMTKLNGNTAGSNPQSTGSEPARAPILSPSSKSIGEASTTSSHDEESSLSNTDTLEHNTNAFQPVGSAFQPPPVSVPSYSSHQGVAYQGLSSASIGQINTLPHYSQAHTFPPEQPLTAPTMFHGHFSTNTSNYTHTPQPPVTGSGSIFFHNNFIYHPQQGGLHGPGFHSVSEYPGPSHVDNFNNFRLENERVNHQLNSINDPTSSRISPEPSGDTGSEASMDSSESSTTGPVDNYKCNDCNKTFNRMCYLTQHRSTYHEGEKPFKCGTCGKRFVDEITFTDHQGKHAGEKPYKCEVCPKQFNHKTDLRRHMCLHTGEKPFSCEQCGKGFIRKDHMLKHFQTHRKKALAAAANAASSHPSMPTNPPGFAAHPGLPPPHGSLPHPSHGPRGHPHVVAPPVY